MKENNDTIDLRALVILLWNKKHLIISITILSAALSVFYALSLPNIYSSKALLVATKQDESLVSQLSNFSSFASIAGVNIPGDNSSKSKEAIARIQSYEFFSNYFLPNINLHDLLAVKEWNQANKELIYDDNLYDIDSKTWHLKSNDQKSEKPSEQEAFKNFKDRLIVTEDPSTLFVSIEIEHLSPYVAKSWVELIINQINDSMREEDIELAEISIEFLKKSQESTNIQSIKEAISSLLESQIQALMLASSNKAYIYKIIDSPIVPEKKSKPRRALICVIGTFLGGLLSLIISFISHYKKATGF